LAIVIGFFLFNVTAFALYSMTTTENYEILRKEEVIKTVAYESERVQRVVAEMERNAIDLALAGYQFYLSGNYSDSLGASVAIENFRAIRSALDGEIWYEKNRDKMRTPSPKSTVGGGIWYEPYVLSPDKKRACYYAFYDPELKDVRHDPEFETESYDYLNQLWYKQVIERLGGKYRAAWAKPYYESIGIKSLLVTVGAGIYDGKGKLVGVSSVDWQIQSMVDRLSAIKPTENSFVLFVSPQDNHVISNTYKNADSSITSIRDLPWSMEDDYFELEGVEYIVFRSIMDNGWLLSVQIPANEIFADIEERNLTFSIGTAISMVLMLCVAFYLLSKLVNHPLKMLTLSVAEISSGNFEKQIELKSKDEFGVLAAAFNKMTAEFRDTLIFCISQQDKEYAEHMEKQRVEAELNIATQIQINMLPCIFPAFPHLAEFDIYATMLPAKEVGGDFYDFFLIDDNTLAVVIADVSGKGVPAALFMVIAKTLLKNTVQNGKTPKEAFETVNNILYENNEAGMFVTTFMGYLDILSGKFTYVNAGHNPPLLYSNGQYSYLHHASSGFVLAALEDRTYTQEELVLKQGDELFLYTDGVTEATNGKKDLFGEARLLETVSHCAGSKLMDFASTVKGKVSEFAEGTEQADDITVLILRYQGNREDT
jgi:sigma-B regulation protein RsbU (phosphoserine phosphatase)